MGLPRRRGSVDSFGLGCGLGGVRSIVRNTSSSLGTVFSMRIPSETMDQVATEIGRSSYWWGNIEYTLQSLCVTLARFSGEELDSEPVWVVLATVLSHMDARQRIAVAKVLAAQGVDPDMYAQIDRLLNFIDNDLRNERNRFVHDQWQLETDGIVRRKHGARVTRPQSRQLAIHQATDKKYRDVHEVAEFATRVGDTLMKLVKLEAELEELHEETWPHEQ
jgi:hypothetical protein